jgi:hypothetical protein
MANGKTYVTITRKMTTGKRNQQTLMPFSFS